MRLERLHPVLAAGRYDVAELVCLAFTNEIANRIVCDQHFTGGSTSRNGRPRQQTQAHDADERLRQLRANLFLLWSFENTDNALHRLRRVPGMQRSEDQVSGFRCGQRSVHGLRLAHLTHYDHVRIAPQRAVYCLSERSDVTTELALIDEGAVREMHVFDGIFDCYNVARLCSVGTVDHRGQCG